MRIRRNSARRHQVAIAGVFLMVLIAVNCDRTPVAPSPSQSLSVTSIEPNMVPVDVLAGIRIVGTGFQPGATVTIGGEATNVTVVSQALLQATAPARSAGTVDVTVTNPGGSVFTLPRAFSYVAFDVSSISPPTGLGGDLVRIAGMGFDGGTNVSIGGAAAVVVGRSISLLTAFVPAHAPGAVDVSVTNSSGSQVTLGGAFTFGAVTLSVTPQVIARGGQLTVTWVAPIGRSVHDWIGIFKIGIPNEAYQVYQYTGGTAQGTMRFAAPVETGDYEFRYLVDDGFVDVARSSTVTVTASTPSHASR